ncbi:hypothetical protein HJG60_010965 [Phyllostomus discolor]|uniref:Uncharacterized protein n=1 Tax=Phyllostomus discolor TaxID=89673 RepID=A0A834ECW9_9CHIR|nr:hypothetical protein HJG60_010965 [Phyllostomus discolor]
MHSRSVRFRRSSHLGGTSQALKQPLLCIFRVEGGVYSIETCLPIRFTRASAGQEADTGTSADYLTQEHHPENEQPYDGGDPDVCEGRDKQLRGLEVDFRWDNFPTFTLLILLSQKSKNWFWSQGLEKGNSTPCLWPWR